MKSETELQNLNWLEFTVEILPFSMKLFTICWLVTLMGNLLESHCQLKKGILCKLQKKHIVVFNQVRPVNYFCNAYWIDIEWK